MAEADLCTGLLNVVTHFVEQHGRPSAPTEEELELFTRMLRHYNGKMHVRQLCLDFDRPLDWMRDHSSRFHVFEDDNGKAVMVGVVARGVRICPNYNISYRTPECRDTHCKGFHVCRDHVGGWCRAGAGCRRSHSFTDSHNRHLTEWFRLDGFSPDELFMILALSTPQVCSDYNNKGCALMSTCTRVHVCRNYVAGTCKNANCDRAHDYQSAHSQRLLGMYRLNALDVDCVRRHLLFYRVIPHRMPVQGRAAGLHALAAVLGCRKEEQRFVDTTAQLLGGDSGDESPPPSVTEDRHNEESIHAKTDLPTPSVRSATSANAVAGLSEKCAFRNRVRKLHSTRVKRYSTKEQQEREKTSAAEVHIHPIAAESINVCEDNIQGTCLFANRCACHHYPQPFVWQVNAFDKWVTLDEVNDVIESSFCDPGKDDVLVKVPCDVFDGAFEMETFGTIQFAGMTMYISLQNMDLKVRRLTTKSYVCTEVDSCYLAAASDDDTHRSCKTRWIWYWESSNGTWNKYENQEPLEENYLSGRSECQFKVDGVMLIVNQTDLVQVNSRTGHRSNLRRRPVFFDTDPKKE